MQRQLYVSSSASWILQQSSVPVFDLFPWGFNPQVYHNVLKSVWGSNLLRVFYFRHLIIKDSYRTTVRTELIRTEVKEERSTLLLLVVLAAELIRHQSEGPGGFLRYLEFVVSPDHLSFRYSGLFPSAKQNLNLESLWGIWGKDVFPLPLDSSDVLGSTPDLESQGV